METRTNLSLGVEKSRSCNVLRMPSSLRQLERALGPDLGVSFLDQAGRNSQRVATDTFLRRIANQKIPSVPLVGESGALDYRDLPVLSRVVDDRTAANQLK